MRALFLDIDGVVSNNLSIFINGMETPFMGRFSKASFDRTTMLALKRVAEVLDAKFILASTWGFNASEEEVKKLAEALEIEIIDKVEDDLVTSRPVMITKWLSEHPEFKQFAIIDDEMKPYVGTPLFRNLVHVDETRGLSFQNIEHLGEIFGVNLFVERKKKDVAASS